MTTVDFITELFCQVDDRLRGLSKHPQACLWPSEVVTLAVLQALKGVGNRAFYRWVVRDYSALISSTTRAHAIVSAVQNALALELCLYGTGNTVGCGRYLWH